MSDKVVFGIYSYVDFNIQGLFNQFVDGYVWILVMRNGYMMFYGLWLDNYLFVEDNGLGLDICEGMEVWVIFLVLCYYELIFEQVK